MCVSWNENCTKSQLGFSPAATLALEAGVCDKGEVCQSLVCPRAGHPILYKPGLFTGKVTSLDGGSFHYWGVSICRFVHVISITNTRFYKIKALESDHGAPAGEKLLSFSLFASFDSARCSNQK